MNDHISKQDAMTTDRREISRTLIRCLVALFGIVGIVALSILSLIMFVLWLDVLVTAEVDWEMVAALHSLWLAIAAALVTIPAWPHRRMRSGRGTIFRAAASAAVVGLTVAVGIQCLQAIRPPVLLNTEADVRPSIERMVKQRARSFSRFARISDLNHQIRILRIKGPTMDFEEATTRWVTFALDTGCGRVIEMFAVLNTGGDGDWLSGGDIDSCDP